MQIANHPLLVRSRFSDADVRSIAEKLHSWGVYNVEASVDRVSSSVSSEQALQSARTRSRDCNPRAIFVANLDCLIGLEQSSSFSSSFDRASTSHDVKTWPPIDSLKARTLAARCLAVHFCFEIRSCFHCLQIYEELQGSSDYNLHQVSEPVDGGSSLSTPSLSTCCSESSAVDLRLLA